MNMKDMMRQAQIMQRKMSEMQEEMKTKQVEGQAGGGMVVVTATGGQEIISVKLDPTVVEGGDIEMLEDLITAAANDAVTKAKAMMESEMQAVTGGLNIPGMM